jgi:Cu/Ag efflux pump CusA
MKIGITSKTHDLMVLSMISYWTIKFRLTRVPGVANIPIWGERIKMLTVQVIPDRLRAYGIPLTAVEEATADALEYSPPAWARPCCPTSRSGTS